MALRKILEDGDPVLRKKSKEVKVFDASLVELFKDMEDTLKKADGAGISAVQVGVLKRAFIVLDKKGFVNVVNPQILSTKGSYKKLIEGCLSVPGKCGEVERPNEVVARFQDLEGNFVERTFTGFNAKAFCHEYDHLDGILYTDKALKMFDSYEDYYDYLDKQEQKEKKNKTKKK